MIRCNSYKHFYQPIQNASVTLNLTLQAANFSQIIELFDKKISSQISVSYVALMFSNQFHLMEIDNR